MEVSLTGKVVLIAGAGPNTGSGLALTFAKYGARVACNDIDPKAAAAAVRRVERNGGEAIAVPGDITNEDAVRSIVRGVLDAWGRIDTLVTCAAVQHRVGVVDCELSDWERVMRVNCTGTWLCTKHVARSMIEREIRGSILCISSASGWQGQRDAIAYCTSKGAILNFVRAAAMDLAPHGIRVNSVSPTATRPDNPDLLNDPTLERRAGASRRGNDGSGRGLPLGEGPTPTDYGHVMAFLASDFARLITGADYRVDSGALARHWGYAPEKPAVPPIPLTPLDAS